MLTLLQAHPALRLAALRGRCSRDRLLLVARYVDALERDFLDAFPDAPPIFPRGMEQEIRHLIEFWKE